MYETPIISGFLWQLINSSFVKTTGYILWTFFCAYLDIPAEQTSLLALLMILDTITGVAKAWRIDWWKSITSHKLGMGAIKKALVFIIIVSLAVTVKGAWVVLGVHWEAGTMLSALIWILMIAEFYSICQNIYMVRTGKRVTEYDAISVVIRNLWEFMRERIDNFLIAKK